MECDLNIAAISDNWVAQDLHSCPVHVDVGVPLLKHCCWAPYVALKTSRAELTAKVRSSGRSNGGGTWLARKGGL